MIFWENGASTVVSTLWKAPANVEILQYLQSIPHIRCISTVEPAPSANFIIFKYSKQKKQTKFAV